MALDFRRNSASAVHTAFIAKATVVLVFLFILLVVAVLFVPERKAAAKNVPSGTYRILSIEVEEGDSLWGIATEYFTEDFGSIHEYILEIKRLNGLSSDTLYAGAYILLPSYR